MQQCFVAEWLPEKRIHSGPPVAYLSVPGPPAEVRWAKMVSKPANRSAGDRPANVLNAAVIADACLVS